MAIVKTDSTAQPVPTPHRWIPPTVSMLVHTVLILLLAMVTFDASRPKIGRIMVIPPPEKEEDPPVEVSLQPEIDVLLENVALVNSAPAPMTAAASANTLQLDPSLLAKADTSAIQISAPAIGIPDAVTLIEAVPDGEVKGEARDIVGSYQQALDRLSQELLWLLDGGPVMAVWCFDQSNSMKDDQQEIRDRFETVYDQLGLSGRFKNDALLTAVTSYGGGFVDHTGHAPTNDLERIREAIDSIPVDATGQEMMCSAVGTTITTYRDLARRGRQMVLILVTDESGNRPNNNAFLEQAIAVAKAANCRIYVIGRESVFGYPFAFFRWQHPQTNRVHWLPMDRGPETAFPEQLQTNGFRRRHDAFSSGFGPYEQTRMARETNGIFFMLPSIEEEVVGRQKESYATEALRPYRPDLRARIEVLADRDEFPLRSLIWQVIQDLNPYQSANQKAIEMRMEFSIKPQEFITQVRQEQEKAKLHLRYMAEAERALINGSLLREQEADPRWQANYDIILAQLIAYQARIYEYGVALDAFIANPKSAEPTRGNRRLVDWDIRTTKRTLTEDAKPYIERATSLFEQIQIDHPGSPWAARARWELQRGYGVDLAPEYRLPYRTVTNPMPVPKL
ncbi:MAG: VWA domain-containing protein [Rubripirellula sp.]|nr:VWA domain-containing protein [Rubripirellula sp.]